MLRSLAFAGLQRVGKVVASVLNRMLEAAQPGMTLASSIRSANVGWPNTVRVRRRG